MKPEITVKEVHEFFDGQHVVKIHRGGYEEAIAVPRAAAAVVDAAITAGIRDGKLWLTSGPASLLGEDVLAGLLTDAAILQAPPGPIPPPDVLPDQLPQAWPGPETTVVSIASALS